MALLANATAIWQLDWLLICILIFYDVLVLDEN